MLSADTAKNLGKALLLEMISSGTSYGVGEYCREREIPASMTLIMEMAVRMGISYGGGKALGLKGEEVTGTENIIDKVKKGKIVLEDARHKGNFGEMNMDDICEHRKGVTRISKDRVINLDDKIKHGIDGVFEDPTGGPPRFIIGESKYGSSQLNILSDGTKQMSYDWVVERLEAAVGKEKAAEILFELEINPDNVQFTLFNTKDSSGAMIEKILDKNGTIKGGNR